MREFDLVFIIIGLRGVGFDDESMAELDDDDASFEIIFLSDQVCVHELRHVIVVVLDVLLSY